jgi:hypothetical protein
VRLLLDEMYPASIAVQLRARGFDVASIHEPGFAHLEGAADEDVFAAALELGRSLVTENVPDFRRLENAALARGERTPGLVFTTNRRFPRGHPATTGRLVTALIALLERTSELPPPTFLQTPSPGSR